MKKYLKPKILRKEFEAKDNFTSLNDWLTNTGSGYQDAGITTYIIES